MFSDADRAVMKENYRNSRMGREAINVMISKVAVSYTHLDVYKRQDEIFLIE